MSKGTARIARVKEDPAKSAYALISKAAGRAKVRREMKRLYGRRKKVAGRR